MANIGGQAVLEGVMMRGPANWAVAVRTPNGDVAPAIATAASRYPELTFRLVSEDELFDAFRWTYARTKLACELGGAAPVAALLAGKAGVRKGDTVVAVVSGGNIAPQQAAAILAQA